MATSRSPGTTSFPLPSAAETQRVLRELCAKPPLAVVIDALSRGGDLHLVGGTVRDVLLGVEPSDLDLATVLRPAEVSERLSRAGIRVVETGIAHGTLTAVIDGSHIEITTFRVPGARTSYSFSSSIHEDLAGRDFTINAIAWDLGTERLLDPARGLDDLHSKILRAVGDPRTRFEEDPHRILRALRFGPGQRRTLHPDTRAAAAACADLLSHVSVERVQTELVRILVSEAPAEALMTMHEIGVLGIILPEALASVGFEQNEFHTQDVFRHTLSVVQRCRPDPLLRLTALFHDLGKPATLSVGEDGRRHFYEHEVVSTEIARRVMERLRFSHDMIANVSTLVRTHMRPIECGPSGVRRLMRDLGDLFERWRQFKMADSPPVMADNEVMERLRSFDALVAQEHARLAALASRRLAVRGEDIMALGVAEGPRVGAVLKQLEELVIENPDLNTRENLLEQAAAFIRAQKALDCG